MIWQYIIPSISTVLVAVIVAISGKDAKRQKRADERAERREAIRAEESKLSMAMMSAAIDLGTATALALERGKTNGEMQAAKEKAAKAQSDYEAFLQRIAARQVAKP